jgi:hypothetical protein
MSKAETRKRTRIISFGCGYSFSDDHINAIIFDALEAKQRPHVVALQYADPEEGAVLAERAGRYLNLMVLGPRVAHIGGRRGTWRLEERHGVSQIEQAFQLDPVEEGADPDGQGALLLGDFACFAQFLGALTRPG